MSFVEQYDKMHDVGKLYLKGYDPTEIAKTLDIKRTEALSFLKDWREWVNSQSAQVGVRDRLMDVLNEVDQHWSMVIKEAWEINEEAKRQGALGIQVNAIKVAQSTGKDRAQLFQQVASDADAELATELADLEERYDQLKNIVKDVVAGCQRCREEFTLRLAQITDEAQVIEVESDEP